MDNKYLFVIPDVHTKKIFSSRISFTLIKLLRIEKNHFPLEYHLI